MRLTWYISLHKHKAMKRPLPDKFLNLIRHKIYETKKLHKISIASDKLSEEIGDIWKQLLRPKIAKNITAQSSLCRFFFSTAPDVLRSEKNPFLIWVWNNSFLNTHSKPLLHNATTTVSANWNNLRVLTLEKS